MGLKLLYLKLRYRKQIKQGFGLLEEHGKKVEITHVMELTPNNLSQKKGTKSK